MRIVSEASQKQQVQRTSRCGIECRKFHLLETTTQSQSSKISEKALTGSIEMIVLANPQYRDIMNGTELRETRLGHHIYRACDYRQNMHHILFLVHDLRRTSSQPVKK